MNDRTKAALDAGPDAVARVTCAQHIGAAIGWLGHQTGPPAQRGRARREVLAFLRLARLQDAGLATALWTGNVAVRLLSLREQAERRRVHDEASERARVLAGRWGWATDPSARRRAPGVG